MRTAGQVTSSSSATKFWRPLPPRSQLIAGGDFSMASPIPSSASCPTKFQFPNCSGLGALAWNRPGSRRCAITTISSSLVSSPPLISAKPNRAQRHLHSPRELYPKMTRMGRHHPSAARTNLVGDVRPACSSSSVPLLFVLLIDCAKCRQSCPRQTTRPPQEIAIRTALVHPLAVVRQVLSETVLLLRNGRRACLFSRALALP